MAKWFGVLFAIDVLEASGVVYFFLWGLSDGTVSSYNMTMWLELLAACGAGLGGALWLRLKRHMAAAIAVSLILAVPAFLFVLFVAFMFIANPRMN